MVRILFNGSSFFYKYKRSDYFTEVSDIQVSACFPSAALRDLILKWAKTWSLTVSSWWVLFGGLYHLFLNMAFSKSIVLNAVFEFEMTVSRWVQTLSSLTTLSARGQGST